MINKARQSRGWISLPVVLLIIMLSALLLQQNALFQDHKAWHAVSALNQDSDIWQEAYSTLNRISSSEGGGENCQGFCRPSKGDWQQGSVEGQRIWLQRQRLTEMSIERWCATFDKMRIKCWWREDSGAERSMWLTAP
ncbi:hypothetical protein [Marinomonas ostreistagni]|uniref:MSHA biogenesis protein MshP n=1 Tax=Marinomonas ostreistagni TaxID=359209 RepID=A0ABS0ZAF1_9GAMM|nr:hypothetical protein [Marinomonas ostreistagni]MBJ7550635.1 hypothetical protein [Marinomonas ostreistagni]